ncbi:MAG: hypothetical protein R3C11_25030 [Planctomycetaceae bacterium]
MNRSGNASELRYEISLTDLQDKLSNSLRVMQFSGGLHTIELTGYIRSSGDQLPITKLGDTITLNVTHNPVTIPPAPPPTP